MRLITSLIVITLTIISCGKKIKDSSEQSTQYLLLNQANYAQFVKDSELSEDVPSSLGQMLIKTDTPSGQAIKSCTWILVDSDMAITNSHCIPAQMLNKNCAEYIGGSFMSDSGVVKRSCKRIVYASKLSQRSTQTSDIALIQLNASVSARPFVIDRSGVIDDELLTVHSIRSTQQASGKLLGTYHRKFCLAKKSHYYGHFEGPLSKTIPVFDSTDDSCKVDETDLGSALTDFSGRLKGVLFSIKQSPIVFNSRIFNIKQIKNVALLINISCGQLHDTKLDAGRSDDCDEILYREQNIRKQRLESIKDELQKLIYLKVNLLVSSLPKSFEYGIIVENINDSRDVGIHIVPSCMLNKDSWPSHEIARTNSHGLFWAKTKYNTELPIYRAKIAVNFNEYGQYDLQTNIERVGKSIIDIDDISEISASKEVDMKITNFIFESKLELIIKIKSCK